MNKAIFFCAVMTLSLSTWGQIKPFGNKDSVGLRGNAFIEFTHGEGQVFWTDALPHNDGTFTAGGTVLSAGVHYMLLARFLPNGQLDCSFQNQGVSDWTIPVNWEFMVKLQPVADGRMLALFHPPDPEKGLSLACFFHDGSLDTSFGRDGILQIQAGEPVHFVSFKQQPDGKFLAGGYTEGATSTCVIHRLLPDGSPDPEFFCKIICPKSMEFHLPALAPFPDGKVLVSTYHGDQLAVFRLLANGAVDLSFGEKGYVFHSVPGFRPYELILDESGAWLALGSGQPAEEGWPVAVKGRADGSLDTSFGSGGVLYFSGGFEAVAAGITEPGGKWTTAGVSEMPGNTGYFSIRRFLPDGRPDPSFGVNGMLAPCFEEEYFQGAGIFLRRLPDGRLLAGGGVNLKGALICLLPDGRPDPDFGEEGLVVSVLGGDNPLDIECAKLLYQEDGKILATGSISKPFDSEILSIRLESDGALDPSFVNQGYAAVHLPNPMTGVDAALQKDGRMVVGGKMRSHNRVTESFDFAICRLNPTGGLDSTFGEKGLVVLDCGPFDILGAVGIQEDGKILAAGDVENPETLDRMLVVYRLRQNGQLDLSFGVDGLCAIEHLTHGSFAALLQQPDGKILLLDAHPPWGFDIVRLLPNGIPDPAFGENGWWKHTFQDAPGNIQSLMGLVAADGRILIAGQLDSRLGIMILGENGAVLSRYYYDIPETAWELAALPDGKFMVAGSGCSDFAPFNYFFGARYLPDGQPDKAFGRNGVLVTELPAFSLLSTLLPLGDGTVILGGKGYTSESDTHSDILLLRYLAGLNAGHLCPAHQFPFLDVYPYPVSAGEFQLTYDLPAQNNVIITLRDPGGKELATLLEVCHPEGSHTETLVFPEGLPPGTYLLHVKTEQVEAQMLILH